jgi:hypothetical protein
MQTRRQVMCSRPAPWLGAWSCAALVERRVVRRGGAHGVADKQSVGCAGRGCGAERRKQECAA